MCWEAVLLLLFVLAEEHSTISCRSVHGYQLIRLRAALISALQSESGLSVFTLVTFYLLLLPKPLLTLYLLSLSLSVCLSLCLFLSGLILPLFKL